MVGGVTVGSARPYGRIGPLGTAEARAMPGVAAVLTHRDVPGRNLYGLEIEDQPVLASDIVRYWGEAVGLVAADHPEQARRAAQEMRVGYQGLQPVTPPQAALSAHAPHLHPHRHITRYVKIRH